MKKKNKKTKKKNMFSVIENKIFHKEEEEDTTFSLFEVIIIILISILFGIVIGYIVTCSKTSIIIKDKNLAEIVNVYNNLTNNYYDKVNKDKLSDGAIKGMVESLDDPFTNYMENETAKEFDRAVKGSFIGIGVTVSYQEDGYYKIIEIIDNTPASKAGLKEDDILIKVNDIDIVKEPKMFESIAKGKVGSKVKLTVKRRNKEKEFNLKRAVVEIQSVHNKIIDYEGLNVGYLKIDVFAANSYKQFKTSMKRFDKNNIDALVIDVRDNPGGHLNQTREILSTFFPKKTVLYQVETKKGSKKIYSMNNSSKNYPVIVLINSASASASEILASCFKENYKNATIVGTSSYGKGTVQKSQSLNDGSSIKYTTEKWLTSKGKWIGDKGIKPDVFVEETKDYCENPNYDNDTQLQEGLKKLKESN
ncbi:MAG: S41 family peptidase [Bacilli bacterium]|nr:S41 family peptidase [Bacilli bacterium]